MYNNNNYNINYNDLIEFFRLIIINQIYKLNIINKNSIFIVIYIMKSSFLYCLKKMIFKICLF